MIVAAKYDQDWNLHEVMKILMDEWRVGHSFESNPDQKSCDVDFPAF